MPIHISVSFRASASLVFCARLVVMTLKVSVFDLSWPGSVSSLGSPSWGVSSSLSSSSSSSSSVSSHVCGVCGAVDGAVGVGASSSSSGSAVLGIPNFGSGVDFGVRVAS